jgi:hypothetical protein
MKRLKRDPLRHDGFNYLAELARQYGVPLPEAATKKRLGSHIVAEVKKLTKNEAYLYGHRAEATFEMIVASLGMVRLLKSEDEGRLYYAASEELRLPDYRIVLPDRRQILVEVKNETDIHNHGPHKAEYFEALVSYASEMGCDLYFAIQWVKWGLWTLVHHRHFVRDQARYQLAFVTAMGENEMALVGDESYGTRAPIRFRIEFKCLEKKILSASHTRQRLVVQRVQLLSEDRVISDDDEKRIAIAFVFYGRWRESEVVETDEHGQVTAVNYDFNPFVPDGEPKRQDEQGFEFIAALSDMIGRIYVAHTTKSGKITGILANFRPGAMREFVPDDYFARKDRALPLWRFTLIASSAESDPAQFEGPPSPS